jgi:hypothetical protein
VLHLTELRNLMMHLLLVVHIHGDVDQTGLERLRAHLRLKKQGRLTDNWDETFGKRFIEYPDGRSIKMALFRHANDRSWTVNVSTTDPVSANDDVTELRAELVSDITAAGFQPSVQAKPR